MNLFGNRDLIAGRQRQLAVLLEAVEQAQQGARALCNSRDGESDVKTDVKLLFDRLEAVRLEVEQLAPGQRHGSVRRD